ncbi:MAG TPA: hypothetical protein IAB12_03425 [Candidatus Ornithospirochaeta avicola]|uniref:DUF7916 domain-containing protein n=1 Tax=Candidatus Ornithospirochaeta avicola TaxID=2840896 RepID=A0A9D1PUF5_9SPIO|nr:hypothetical protein [Candidatus Ornithospirochaeta avicola]
MKRILDLMPSELISLSAEELYYALSQAEGRTLACETIGIAMPMLVDISNAELAASLGADLIILNMFDVDNPEILGLPDTPACDVIRCVKKLSGRAVGVNLEPAKVGEDDSIWAMKKGRVANAENALKLLQMGADFIVITGNPGNGVRNEDISGAIKEIKDAVKNNMLIFSGKMHASGIIGEGGENIVSKDDIKSFVSAGSDVILLPAPYTVPGITGEYIRSLVSYTHSLGRLTMTAIGTSQEGSDADTIKKIALEAKATGTDIHHIGDSGYMGMALPENIFTYSVAIRGVRHTYRRMAARER